MLCVVYYFCRLATCLPQTYTLRTNWGHTVSRLCDATCCCNTCLWTCLFVCVCFALHSSCVFEQPSLLLVNRPHTPLLKTLVCVLVTLPHTYTHICTYTRMSHHIPLPLIGRATTDNCLTHHFIGLGLPCFGDSACPVLGYSLASQRLGSVGRSRVSTEQAIVLCGDQTTTHVSLPHAFRGAVLCWHVCVRSPAHTPTYYLYCINTLFFWCWNWGTTCSHL